jgi:hypothetical protein
MIDRLAHRMIPLAAAFAVAAVLAAPAALHAATSLPLPIVGTAPAGGSFSGAFALARFAVNKGQVVAIGTLTGIVTNAAGKTTTISQAVSLPVNVGTTTCQILHLDVGPISLNLLGLQVNLSEIVLDITAHSAPGNLLGNLLCDVANLIGNSSGLANLLNQILAIIA